MLAFTAHRLLTPSQIVERPLLLVDSGHVLEVTTLAARSLPAGVSAVDLGDSVIAPGYIDLHIHGNAGFDVMQDSPDALPAIGCALARHGVTSYCPTTVTAPVDATLAALERLAHAIEESARADAAPGARPIGIHLEGPFISHARRGVHPPADLLPPKLETFERFWQAARGHIRMITIAPEIEGALELIAEAAHRGVCVSLGHSDATFAIAESAVAAGARHATHTFNAMRPLDHRDPGILGAVLTDSRLSADVIADGIHVDPSIVKLFATAKGADHTVLITDGISATGMPDGHYRLGSFDVDVKDGRCTANGKLAGSVLTMDRAVRNLARFAEWPLAQAVGAATRNPARAAALSGKGTLSAGADADFVVLNSAGEVQRTFVAGIECT
jgi:N-acetylglucosamine-6-phosphate deacetylase